jgi:hypothetical protein
MRPRWHRRSGAVALAAIAMLVTASLERVGHAHDATDAPPRSPAESQARPAGAGAPAPARTSIAWPLLLLRAGAATTAAGGWLLHDENRPQAGACVNGPTGRVSCTSPSGGPGLGLAVLAVGAQATVGSLVWLAIRWREGSAPVALQLGPGSLALRASF